VRPRIWKCVGVIWPGELRGALGHRCRTDCRRSCGTLTLRERHEEYLLSESEVAHEHRAREKRNSVANQVTSSGSVGTTSSPHERFLRIGDWGQKHFLISGFVRYKVCSQGCSV
jgi:hypothetical protein